jgi:hypothetical protein
MFEKGEVILPKLKVTGDMTVIGTTNTKNVVTNGTIQVGTDKKKATTTSSNGTYWKHGNSYTWAGVDGFTTYDGSDRSSMFPKYIETGKSKIDKDGTHYNKQKALYNKDKIHIRTYDDYGLNWCNQPMGCEYYMASWKKASPGGNLYIQKQ